MLNVVGSREGWELFIVTGGVMVYNIPTITSPVTIYSSHPSLLGRLSQQDNV
jgi:hypothetical protein